MENVLFSAVQQCRSIWQLHIYLTPLGPPSTPPIHPSRVIIEHHAELLTLYSSFPLSICFLHGSVYMSTVLFQFVPPSPYATVSVNPFSTIYCHYSLTYQNRFISSRCSLGSSLTWKFFSSNFISQVFIFLHTYT